MNDILDSIADQLRDHTLDEVIALVRDFLAGVDQHQQRRFLNLLTTEPRPLVAEAMALADAEDLLNTIQALHDAIANDEYIQQGSGFDPEYGEYRGFGADSWIDEIDDLFAATTSLFQAGHFAAAAAAYRALFRIFDLGGDGFHFTRSDPVAALGTDVDAMKENLFVVIAGSDPDPVHTDIEASDRTAYYGHNLYALLDAWQDRADLMAALEAALIEEAREPTPQDMLSHGMAHSNHLLRELYRRYRTLQDYEALCREIGPRQGLAPYEDVVGRLREQGHSLTAPTRSCSSPTPATQPSRTRCVRRSKAEITKRSGGEPRAQQFTMFQARAVSP